MGQLRRTDGGLATELQRHGLPKNTPVDAWVLQHPDRVLAAQSAFVDAGAQILLTATFRVLPSLQPDWERVIDEAARIAREAAGAKAQVWGSIGPTGQAWALMGPQERQTAGEDWAQVAQRLNPRVDGLVLETFADPIEAGAALYAVRVEVGETPIVVSLTPQADGTLLGGREPGPALAALQAAGASAVGFNCGVGPDGVVRAVERCSQRDLWLRPAGDSQDPDALATALATHVSRCAVIGGCCGATPVAITALGAICA
jgi:5-methyltetrahydrofolate--homocysteine methyltransferase